MLSILRYSCLAGNYKLANTQRLLAFRILAPTARMSTDTAALDNQDAPGLMEIFKSNPKRLGRINFLRGLFKTAGYELRIAGGAVRDILTGVEPKDIDFATTALPSDSLDILKKHEDIVRIIITTSGQKHGTVAVKFKEPKSDLKRIKLDTDASSKGDETSKPEYDEESPFEITTLRCDVVTDGRHAEVKFVNDWKIDAERRDLTINAMFLTLDEGKLIDYFNGQTDLSEGKVRFVGNADLRLKEDYLRILRFFRFWSRYSKGNPPDDATKEVIKKNLAGLESISGERIWQELKKMFNHLPCAKMVQLILEIGLTRFIGLVDDKASDADGYKSFVTSQIEEVEKYMVEFTERAQKESTLSDLYTDKKIMDLKPTILFTCLTETNEMCLAALKRMKFSNMERDVMIFITENRKQGFTVAQMKRQLALAHGPDAASLKTKLITLMIYRGEFDKLGEEMKTRQLHVKNMKVVVEYLKNQWADSEYRKTQEDLEKDLITKLDELKRDSN